MVIVTLDPNRTMDSLAVKAALEERGCFVIIAPPDAVTVREVIRPPRSKPRKTVAKRLKSGKRLSR